MKIQPIKGANEYLPDFQCGDKGKKGTFLVVLYPSLHPTIKITIQQCRTGVSVHNAADKWQKKENARIKSLINQYSK